MNLSERLALELVRVSDKNECIEWAGAKTSSGYPLLTTEGKQVLVTRYVKSWHNKIPMPDRSIVCRHTCDNPPCINPQHLVWGSQKDNSKDAIERERTARGEKLPQAKLTDIDVIDARILFLQSSSLVAVTSHYGIGNNAAKQMLTGKTWSHVPGAISEQEYKETTRRQIPEQELETVRILRHLHNLSWQGIADIMHYGSAMTPYRIYKKGLEDGGFSENPDAI